MHVQKITISVLIIFLLHSAYTHASSQDFIGLGLLSVVRSQKNHANL